MSKLSSIDGCFQKACGFAVTMQKENQVILAIILLLGVISNPYLFDHANNLEHSDEIMELNTESEQLSIAAQNWHQASSYMIQGQEVKALSGMLNLAHGSYDPLTNNAPDLPEDFIANEDYLSTGLMFVQSIEYDFDWLFELQDKSFLQVLDNLGDGNFIIRLGNNQQATIDILSTSGEVRWFGNINPGFRVHPSIMYDYNYQSLALIPSDDLGYGGYESLALSLINYGAIDAWCGYTTCQVTVQDSLEFSNLASKDGRIIWIEPVSEMVVHNAVARAITGVVDVESLATFTLDGSGEMLAIADTGLDRDHPDINGRVAAVYTQFGLDTSPADTNGGHGTHVTLTAVGDGSGDTSSKGIAPSAGVTMYALEHDPTGVFGRQGSIYDLLLDAKQKTARIAINAWGLNGNFGEYTADSRSVDQFVHDESTLLPIFSVGDADGQGSQLITAPATAKNVLSVGVSTTGSLGTTPEGSVDSNSREGFTLDNRIKPDVVAPGIEICSGRAEEAKSPIGFACGAGVHTDGDPLYMSVSGTSQSASVAGGLAALTREFIREQVNIASPSASLIKAAMINGADDLGAPDIPNQNEGWGQLNLENTVMPTDGSQVLATYFDDGKVLQPSFGLVYELTLDPSHGIDITLAWNDDPGSANSPQSEAKLVNDLDLLLTAPNGDTWLGNNFASGFSVAGGTADSINNVERISLAPAIGSTSGQWLVQILHRGGSNQDFSVVMTADASLISRPDLVAFPESIYLSSQSPLQNDIFSLRVSWMNQGTASAAGFHWILEDITEGLILMEGDSQGVSSSQIQSEITTRSFSTTGIHTLKLSLDTNNVLDEMNDESSGVNNNIIEVDIEVTALGVRVVPLNDDGSVPSLEVDRQQAAIKNFDVRNETSIDIPITIMNEGTGSEAVTLSYTNIQEKHPIFNYFISPEDAWTKSVSQTSPYTLGPQGANDDSIELVLTFENLYADLSDPTTPRYARSGTFYVDVTVAYQSLPLVSHSMRLTIIIDEVDDVKIVVSGTNGLSALPGESAAFAISALNVGNSQAQYSVECYSENLWQIMLGNSNSSSLDFEPLDIANYLSMPVRIFVPPVSSGSPVAGYQDTVECYVTSTTDQTLNYTQSVTITVLELSDYSTNLGLNGNDVGTNLELREIMIDSGEEITLDYTVINEGNIEIELDVIVQPSNPSWYVELVVDELSYSKEVTIQVPAGESKVVEIIVISPTSSLEGDFNLFNIKAEVSNFDYVINATKLIIMDKLSIDLQSPDLIECAIGSDYSFTDFSLTNDGNSLADLEWSFSLPPDGWIVGFANPVTSLEPRQSANISLGIIPPVNQPVVGSAFKMTVSVTAQNGDRQVVKSVLLDVSVIDSTFGNMTLDGEVLQPLLGVPKGSSQSSAVILRNDGNTPISGTLTIVILDDDGMIVSGWSPKVNPNSITMLNPGEFESLEITLNPSEDVSRGPYQVVVNLSNAEGIISAISLQTSSSPADGNSGLFNIVPWYISVVILVSLAIVLVVVSRRMKSSGSFNDDGTELIAANAYTTPGYVGGRRDKVLDIGMASDEMTSGEVSQDEIAAALAQSMGSQFSQPITPVPSAAFPPLGMPPAGMPPINQLPQGMPPALPQKSIPSIPPPPITPQQANQPDIPPLPATGLPPGWTIEQWNAYGHMWIKKNQP